MTHEDPEHRGKPPAMPSTSPSHSTSPPPNDPSSSNDPGPDYESEHPDAPLPHKPYRDDPELEEAEPWPIEDVDATAAAAGSKPRRAWLVRTKMFWLKNKGMFLVLLSQMFGASMNVITQVLEIHSSMHPFQVLFARMSITALVCYLYMWYAAVPAPFGAKPVRPLLLARATSGFLGVYGLYYSVQYLPLSEATVITFLAPIMTCYACSFWIPGETFSRRQQLAALVSLVGVVLIAHPFRARDALEDGNGDGNDDGDTPSSADSYHHVLATIVACVGVLGAAGAYTSIRMIGRRAHPLVSVTYFSSVTTVISFVAMAAVPGVPFRVPSTPVEWTLLTGLGVCGFLLQFLLTAGLSYVPPPSVSSGQGQGSRATSMVYTQMIFALFYDKVVWGSTLGPVSWAGSVLILACAIYVAVMQEGGKLDPKKPEREGGDTHAPYKDVEDGSD
ncbi:hypothetical protein N7492_010151 [Penicillium capsulatum]|uniref:EamA domain-containing protein n=1 Tax=Penicillium capsulatum TaxID=69766 RepID=A0A9W9HLV6_9EURO|nr:hypothetical protein N7492_010151 [Penicillium capsulatum]KAJ6112659.1 hypothetical protein N7512_007983 [Penicillium capsulatum]